MRSPRSGGKYFLDANVWYYYFNSINPSNRQKKYIKFVDDIIGFNDSPKPKIIVSNLVISEVVNRSLRSIDMLRYAEDQGDNPQEYSRINKKDYYKTVYRKTEQFRSDYDKRCSDFKDFLGIIEFSKDCSDLLRPGDILSSKGVNIDFNDRIFIRFAKKYEYIVVTDDGDFWEKNITIYTANNDLLEKQKELLVIKA